jgi:hypothetical protein
MKDFDLQQLIDSLPAGLDRAILRVLSFHIGRKNAISRRKLVNDLVSMGFDYRKDDRPVRECINLMRKEGKRICSAGGLKGGYWIAKDWTELDEFIDKELHSRAMDMLEQEKALRKAAEELWGRYSPEQQTRLF